MLTPCLQQLPVSVVFVLVFLHFGSITKMAETTVMAVNCMKWVFHLARIPDAARNVRYRPHYNWPGNLKTHRANSEKRHRKGALL